MSHRTTVPIMTRPTPRLLKPAELADIRCKAHSGLVEPAEVLALLGYVGLLEASLLGKRDRLAISGEEGNDG